MKPKNEKEKSEKSATLAILEWVKQTSEINKWKHWPY